MRLRDVARSLAGSSAFVFVATLVLHGIPLPVGPILGGDGPLYSALADRILRGDWSGVLDSSRLLWTKAVFIGILAAAKAIAPVRWPHLIVAMNVVCSAATATLVVSFVRRATSSVTAAGAAFLFYVGSFDTYFWNRFVMTDALYTLFATAVFVLVARPVVDGRPPRSLLPLIAYVFLAVLTRPPGAVLIFSAVLGVVAFWRNGRELTARQRRVLWALVLITMIGGVAFRTYIVQEPQRWPFHFVRPKIEEFARREKTGEVVAGSITTFRTPPATYADHLVIQASRFVRFFQFLSSEFSPRHNLVHALYFIPLYALCILGIVNGLRTTDRKRRDLVLLLLSWIVVFAYYHALTVLLWRYRGPLMPQLIILAACGVEALQTMIASRRAGTIEPSR